jgi:hypothetical protein
MTDLQSFRSLENRRNMATDLKYPCCVCTQELCTAPNCPAKTKRGKKEYMARLEELLDREIPEDSEEEAISVPFFV